MGTEIVVPVASRGCQSAGERIRHPDVWSSALLVAAWVLSALLAAAYLFFGAMKITKASGLLPRPQERGIGVLEVLGAIGVVVPELVGVARFLTPTAAIALALLQVLAIVFHLSRGERKQLPVNVVLLLIAAVDAVLWIVVD